MQALDTLKREMYVHINCTFQDSVGPSLIYSTWRQRGRKPRRVSHGDKQTRALVLRKAPRQLLSPCCLPFLAQLGLGTSPLIALKTRLSKTQARTRCRKFLILRLGGRSWLFRLLICWPRVHLFHGSPTLSPSTAPPLT